MICWRVSEGTVCIQEGQGTSLENSAFSIDDGEVGDSLPIVSPRHVDQRQKGFVVADDEVLQLMLNASRSRHISKMFSRGNLFYNLPEEDP